MTEFMLRDIAAKVRREEKMQDVALQARAERFVERMNTELAKPCWAPLLRHQTTQLRASLVKEMHAVSKELAQQSEENDWSESVEWRCIVSVLLMPAVEVLAEFANQLPEDGREAFINILVHAIYFHDPERPCFVTPIRATSEENHDEQ